MGCVSFDSGLVSQLVRNVDYRLPFLGLMVDANCPISIGRGIEKHCDYCATPLSGRRTRWCSAEHCRLWYVSHDWNMARKAARRRDRYKCVKCGSKEKIEVNHIKPLWGQKRAELSCLHHPDNLQVLCHACHVEVTNQQRKIYG